MNFKFIEKLEYNKILNILSSFCVTDFGKGLCQNLKPSSDKDLVLNLLKETSEATLLLEKKCSINITRLRIIIVK